MHDFSGKIQELFFQENVFQGKFKNGFSKNKFLKENVYPRKRLSEKTFIRENANKRFHVCFYISRAVTGLYTHCGFSGKIHLWFIREKVFRGKRLSRKTFIQENVIQGKSFSRKGVYQGKRFSGKWFFREIP